MEMNLYYKYLLHGAHRGRAVTLGPAGVRAGSTCSDSAHHHGTLGEVL